MTATLMLGRFADDFGNSVYPLEVVVLEQRNYFYFGDWLTFGKKTV